jgi:hypothetical protein
MCIFLIRKDSKKNKQNESSFPDSNLVLRDLKIYIVKFKKGSSIGQKGLFRRKYLILIQLHLYKMYLFCEIIFVISKIVTILLSLIPNLS